MVEVPVKLYLDKLLKTARESARPFSLMPGPSRDKALRAMAAGIAEAEEAILAANEKDVEAVGKSMTGYENRERVRDAVARVRMTADDVKAMVDRLHRIADLPDPLGEMLGAMMNRTVCKSVGSGSRSESSGSSPKWRRWRLSTR